MNGQALPPRSFPGSPRNSRLLERLHEEFLASGSQYTLATFSPLLLRHLESSPDPEMALTNLVRFVEASFSRTAFFNDLVRLPVLPDLLVKLLGNSQYFSDILVRDPTLPQWLISTNVLNTRLTAASLQPELRRIEEAFQKPERRLDALKRIHRREILRVGAQDLLGIFGLRELTLELSELADAMVAGALMVAAAQVADRFPLPPATPFAVIGLGKLGGRELNYSSDIDVVFAYRDEGEVSEGLGGRGGPGPAGYTHHEYFNALCERLVQNLSQSSAEGYLYRVDTRLRPESGAGPLARSVGSYLAYYESRGELWERQMLMKAHPVAGDRDFGAAFLRQLEPFVMPRSSILHPAETVARVKARIERAAADEANIKLMPGGIRDIEFVAQTLQLIHGPSRPEIRTGNTLEALAALEGARLLTTEESRALREAYTLYRTMEHRLQMMLNTQTHRLPDDERLFALLATRVGCASADGLRLLLGRSLGAVRGVFEQVMVSGPSGEEVDLLGILDGGMGEESVQEFLRSRGFRDGRLALRNLRTLVAGGALTGARTVDRRTREAFRAVAPMLFDEIGTTPDPDMTLSGVSLLAAAQKFPQQFFDLMGGAGFRKFILDVCKISPRLARGLARDPLLLETLAADSGALARWSARGPEGASLVEFKNREEVRLGVRYVLGFTPFETLTGDLSSLADAILRSVMEEELKKARLASAPLVVLALGKYGTGELNFDGDLDVIFVCGDKALPKMSRLEAAAAKIVSRLSAVTAEGRLYEVDTRLRPEGRNAPLVAVEERYLRYLETRASLWERQSLTRLRAVCGDPDLVSGLPRSTARRTYERPLPRGWVEETLAMRKKMESRSRLGGPTPLDVKLGEGGMADIEFLVQMAQLRYGGESASLRFGTVDSILGTGEIPSLTRGEREHLRETYRFYRRIETLLRLALEERNTLLPEGPRLDLLARCLGEPTGAGLRERVTESMRATRRSFLEMARRFAA
jgi:glutamate-ammonia-ligase adenylyltransferase